MKHWREFSKEFDKLAQKIEFWEDDMSEELNNAKNHLNTTLCKYEKKDCSTLNSYLNFQESFNKVTSLIFLNLTRVVDMDSQESRKRYETDCIKNFYAAKKIEKKFRKLILEHE